MHYDAECAHVVAAIKHLGSYVTGQDPMNTGAIQLMLYGITQRQIGGLAHQAISGLDAALLDIKGKALGVPVYQLFGGPVRDKIRVYSTHCGRLEPQNPDLPPPVLRPTSRRQWRTSASEALRPSRPT